MNAHGGGFSFAVGSYHFFSISEILIRSVFIAGLSTDLINTSFSRCGSKSLSSGYSNDAFSFGGAFSYVVDSYSNPEIVSDSFLATAKSSRLNISRCIFSESVSSSCSLAVVLSIAAGGAVFVSALDQNTTVSDCVMSFCFVRTGCGAMTSEAYSLGGGISIFRAGDVMIDTTILTNCLAGGISTQANNVFVSGGGIFVQASKSFTLQSSEVSSCRVENAFSVRLPACGGGAIGTKNVSMIRISSSAVFNNSDSSLTGSVFLQQPSETFVMIVDIINGSNLSADPSISTVLPVLNIYCGFNCSVEQQQRMRLNIADSSLLAQNLSPSQFPSAAVLSLPGSSLILATNSLVSCNFTGFENIAVISRSSADRFVINCAPCEKPFFIATSSRTLDLKNLALFAASESCRPSTLKSFGSTSEKEQHCPFGVSSCSTVVNIAVGFWANFTPDGDVSDATRCPLQYCGCRNILNYAQTSCTLFPPYAVEFRPEDALCSGNRTGTLCGGCKSNFTQSLNGFSCVHNDDCQNGLPWVWAITVTGHFIYALYIVSTSMEINNGFIMCVLFYGQLSSFASLPPNFVNLEPDQNDFSSWFSQVSQFGSIVSVYNKSCYALGMGAYAAMAAKLCGPAIVFVFSLLLTSAAQHLPPRFINFLSQRNIDIRISFGATLINVVLLLFSSVSSVVFQLITCQRVGDKYVVFIDGTEECNGRVYHMLIAVAVLLGGMPIVFWALLKLHKIPAPAKSAICSAYTGSRYYWVAVTLLFRFLMTVIFATARDFPSLTAFALLICSILMFGLLIFLRPYVELRTYCMDIFCYVCLMVQFALQCLVRDSESLGVAVVSSNPFYSIIVKAVSASSVLRFAF
jgi:hypothetical protein